MITSIVSYVFYTFYIINTVCCLSEYIANISIFSCLLITSVLEFVHIPDISIWVSHQ